MIPRLIEDEYKLLMRNAENKPLVHLSAGVAYLSLGHKVIFRRGRVNQNMLVAELWPFKAMSYLHKQIVCRITPAPTVTINAPGPSGPVVAPDVPEQEEQPKSVSESNPSWDALKSFKF